MKCLRNIAESNKAKKKYFMSRIYEMQQKLQDKKKNRRRITELNEIQKIDFWNKCCLGEGFSCLRFDETFAVQKSDLRI